MNKKTYFAPSCKIFECESEDIIAQSALEWRGDVSFCMELQDTYENDTNGGGRYSGTYRTTLWGD